jgi:hypothetical protein
MKNSNDTIGNRTSELPAFNAVLLITTPTRAPHMTSTGYKGDGFLGRDAMRFGMYVPSFGAIRCLPVSKRYKIGLNLRTEM